MGLFLPIKIRYELRNQILKERLDTLIPALMQETDIDMWIVAAREHNEDPVMFTMLPAPMMSARRTTILVFAKLADGTVDRLCLGRKNAGLNHYYKDAWINQKESDWSFDTMLMPDRDNGDAASDAPAEFQMECLARLVREYSPKKIGLNISPKTAFADGLSHSLYNEIVSSLDEIFRDRITSAEWLCIRWLETRIDAEMYLYRRMVKASHAIIQKGLSNAVIQPGVTRKADLGFWLMEEGERFGFFNWFNAVITIRRNGVNIGKDVVIEPGDLVHVDVGYECMGYHCDSQANAYILRPGESTPPKSLVELYEKARAAHHTLMASFKEGLTGDEILLAARNKLAADYPELVPFIFVHPIGVHGHAAGPNVGRTDNQRFVREMGWYPLHENTLHAMEMCLMGHIPEIPDKYVVMGLETETVFRNGQIEEIDPQKELYLVHTV